MKKVSAILEKEYGVSFSKNSLTEEEIREMISFDWENSSSIPDTKQYKIEFLKTRQDKYKKLGLNEEWEKWVEEEERVRTTYPAIHKTGE